MRIFFCLLFLFTLSYTLSAQDDIPNYHSKRENFSKMIEKDARADIASFALAGLDEAAGKEPLPYVPVVEYSDEYVLLSKDNIKVKIIAGKFDKTKHKILYYDEKYVTKIDNKPFYGVDGQMPVKTIQSIIVTIGSDSINIPVTAYSDLYEPWFCKPGGADQKAKCHTGVYLSRDNHRLYIYMLSGDGFKGKGYEVTWVIQDNKYLRRVLDDDF